MQDALKQHEKRATCQRDKIPRNQTYQCPSYQTQKKRAGHARVRKYVSKAAISCKVKLYNKLLTVIFNKTSQLEKQIPCDFLSFQVDN